MKRIEYMLLGEIADELHILHIYEEAFNMTPQQADRLRALREALDAARAGKPHAQP